MTAKPLVGGSLELPSNTIYAATRSRVVTVHAHFDGKVIVPDEPLNLRPNQPLIVQIQPLEGETGESALAWIAANAVDSDALPADLSAQHDHYLYGRQKRESGE